MIPAVSAATGGGAGLGYRWVGVGDGGNLWTCDDATATTWTQRTSSFGGTSINGVASNGINLYVAVGDSGKLATSPDGVTWTQQTSSFGASNISGIAYGNGVWIASGQTGKLATSTDGTTWTQRTTGTTDYLYKCAYGNGVYAAGGANGRLISTTTPTSTWTSRTSTITGNISFLTYAPFASIWVAGNDTGTTGALASSPDATTWTARTSSVSLSSGQFSSDSSNTIICVTTGGNATGAVQLISTTDGISYTNRTLATGTGNNSRAVAADINGTFICLADNATAGYWGTNYSTNGTTWTAGTVVAATAGLGSFARAICSSAGTYSSR